MYRADQDADTGSGQAGSESEPGDDDLSYHQDLDTHSDIDADGNYCQAYGEDSVVAHTVNQVEVVYQDDYEGEFAYWEWGPRHTLFFLVHMTPAQDTSYWCQ